MPASNGIMIAPVEIHDVYRMLGVPMDKGFDIGYACSNTHQQTNKWAKYKPVIRQNYIDNSNPLYWQADDGYAGLSIRISTTFPDAISIASNNKYDYPYVPPFGGILRPYRLLDFNGYKHDSVNSFSYFNVPASVYKSSGNATISMRIDQVANENLSIKDLGNFANWYPCVVLQVGTSNTFYAITTPNPLLSYIGNTFDINIPLDQLSAGTYNVYAFISNNSVPVLVSSTSGVFDQIAYLPKQPAQMIIRDGYPIMMTLVIQRIDTETNARYTAEFTYLGDGQQELEGCYIDIRYGNRQPSDSMVTPDMGINLGTIMVTPTTQTLTGDFTLNDTIYNVTGCWLLSRTPSSQIPGAIIR